MIPVADVIRPRTTPWVTMGLVAANAIIFVYQRVLSPGDVLADAAFVAGDPSFARALLSLVVHENTLHLVLNLLVLWIFGDNVEDQLGHGRFLATYALAGVASCYAVVWAGAAPFVPVAGASGAIAGVIGAYFAMFPRSRVLFLTPAKSIVDAVELPAVIVAAGWLATQVTVGLGRIADPWTGGGAPALWPLAGGLTAGLAASRIARRPERRRVEWWDA
jgi:membrane associated rhomboid family serine protease